MIEMIKISWKGDLSVAVIPLQSERPTPLSELADPRSASGLVSWLLTEA